MREAFVPSLGELKDAYAVEAHRSTERRPLLGSLKVELERLATPDGEKLLATATKFLDAGDRLNAILDARGAVPRSDRGQAARLRGRAVGLLNALRADLAEEVARDPALPRDLEQRVFGYLDTLAAMVKAPPGTTGTPPVVEPVRPV